MSHEKKLVHLFRILYTNGKVAAADYSVYGWAHEMGNNRAAQWIKSNTTNKVKTKTEKKKKRRRNTQRKPNSAVAPRTASVSLLLLFYISFSISTFRRYLDLNLIYLFDVVFFFHFRFVCNICCGRETDCRWSNWIEMRKAVHFNDVGKSYKLFKVYACVLINK